jgi:hypothetical protein
VAGCCEYGDEPSGSGATELVMSVVWREPIITWSVWLYVDSSSDLHVSL